jgi:hypothetical protein
MKQIKKIPWHKKHRTALRLGIIVGILVIAGGVIWYIHDHDTPKPAAVVNTNTGDTSGKSVIGGTGNTTPSPGSSTNDTTSGASGSATTTPNQSATSIGPTPEAPSGAFVSNHTPGANGSPLSENSICNVAPGVACTITFTKGDQKISLPVQTAGASGSLSWNWTPAGESLTAGSWNIVAVATYNNASASTSDSRALVIQ